MIHKRRTNHSYKTKTKVENKQASFKTFWWNCSCFLRLTSDFVSVVYLELDEKDIEAIEGILLNKLGQEKQKSNKPGNEEKY